MMTLLTNLFKNTARFPASRFKVISQRFFSKYGLDESVNDCLTSFKNKSYTQGQVKYIKSTVFNNIRIWKRISEHSQLLKQKRMH